MSQYVEFDYETNDNRILTIHGETDGNEIYFKIYDQNADKRVSRNTLTQFDIQNIEDFIKENAKEFETLIDFDDFEND